MAISISPIAIVLIIIVISNCAMSFGKSKLMNRCYVIISSVLSILGIIGMIVTRPRFVESLNRNANTREFESDFVAWAIDKFDSFAIVSTIVTCSIIMILVLYLLLNRNKQHGFLWENITIVVITLMIINIIAGFWYGLGTINKLFDIAGYISLWTVAEFFALHIPLITKRILMLNK